MSDDAGHRSDIGAIRMIAKRCALRMGVSDMVVFDGPRGDGSPYVEVSDAYCFVVEERGVELERRKTNDLDELLYWIFDCVTFSMASSAELANRNPNEDSRRQLFSRQEALLSRISGTWGQRAAAEHRSIVARHPFNDHLR